MCAARFADIRALPPKLFKPCVHDTGSHMIIAKKYNDFLRMVDDLKDLELSRENSVYLSSLLCDIVYHITQFNEVTASRRRWKQPPNICERSGVDIPLNELVQKVMETKIGTDLEKVNPDTIGTDPVQGRKGELHLTPLMLACFADDLQLMEVILEGGADKDKADLDGLTPLHLAARARVNGLEMMRILFKKGARLDAERIGCWSILAEICFSDAKDYDKRITLLLTQIHESKRAGYLSKLSAGGGTALHIMVLNGATQTVADAVQIMFDAGIDKEIKDQCGRTALAKCLQYAKEFVVIDVFKKYKADVNTRDNGGNTPLHVSRHYKNTFITNWLRLAGALPYVQNNAGESAETGLFSAPKGFIYEPLA